jgi:hypothetical protein
VNSCTADGSPVPDQPDGETWVDDDFFGWVHRTTSWHTIDGRRLRKLRGALAFVEDAGGELRHSPPGVDEDDLEP